MFTRLQLAATLASAACLAGAVLVPAGVSALADSESGPGVPGELSDAGGGYQLRLVRAADSDGDDGAPSFVAVLTRPAGGGTYLPAAGERVDLGLAGSGSIVGAVPSGPNPGSCVTAAAGTCTVTIRSTDAGGTTLAAMAGDQVATIGVGAPAAPTG